MSVGLRQAWRDSKPVFDLVPHSKRTLAWATLGTVVNGAAAVFFGLSLGPAMNAVQGAASSWWMAAPLTLWGVEYATTIRPTNKLIALSERTRLNGVNTIVQRALRRNKDADTASNAEVSVGVAKQLEETRELFVDLWRWAVAQVSRMGVSIAAVAAITATGYAGFGPVGPLAVVVGAVSTAVASSVVTNAIAIRKNRATDEAAIELHEAVQEDVIETDPTLIRSVGGIEAVQRVSDKISSLALRLHDHSTDNRHWLKSSQNFSSRLVQLSIALLPLLAVPVFGVTTNIAASFATSIAVGLTLAPVALSAADLTTRSLQTLTTSVSRLGKSLRKLATENDREGTRTLPALHQTSVEISNGRVDVGVDGSRTTVLDGIDLSLSLGGRVHVFTGASGIGKSTLIDVVTASRRLHAGSITIAGIPYADIDERSFRSRVRQLPQRLTVAGNGTIEKFAWDSDRPVQAQGERVTALRCCMDEFGLREVSFDRLWKTLSGGQQRRAMLAVILTSDAELVVLDEPTNDLDIEAIKALAQRINSDTATGRTFIISSHDQGFLQQLARCTHHELVRGESNAPASVRSLPSARGLSPVSPSARQQQPGGTRREAPVATSGSATTPTRGAVAGTRTGAAARATSATSDVAPAGTTAPTTQRLIPARILGNENAELGYKLISSEVGTDALVVAGRDDDKIRQSARLLAAGLRSPEGHDWLVGNDRAVSWLVRIGKDLKRSGMVDDAGNREREISSEQLGRWLLDRHRSAVLELGWEAQYVRSATSRTGAVLV